MGRSMGHPAYVRGYITEEHRARLSAAQLKRWGAPEGFCTVRGVHVPLEYRDDVKPFADWIAGRFGKSKAEAWVRSIADSDWAVMPRLSELAEEWRAIKENRRMCYLLSNWWAR